METGLNVSQMKRELFEDYVEEVGLNWKKKV